MILVERQKQPFARDLVSMNETAYEIYGPYFAHRSVHLSAMTATLSE